MIDHVTDEAPEQLLAISSPERLFPGDLAAAKRRYHAYASVWHPDRNADPRAHAVFTHLTTLYHEAVTAIQAGRWPAGGTATLIAINGKALTFDYRAGLPFELGWCYIADTHVTYVVEPVHKDLWEAARRRLTGGFTYASKRMESEAARYLPTGMVATLLAEGRLALRVDKSPDLILLRDAARALAPLDPRHVAWILSTLYSLACYLSHVGIVHLGIGLETYFISPPHHSGALLGGWWYSAAVGGTVGLVPARTYDCLPWEVRRNRTASPLADQELIRLTGRELVGDRPVPPPMRSWLDGVATGTAVETYAAWMAVLEESFGPRRFTAMALTADMVYPEEGR